MARLEGDAEREPGRHGIRQLEAGGRRPHPRPATQPREVGDGEARPVGVGHLDDPEVEQPLAGAVERLGEGAEHQRLAVAQEEPGGGLPDERGRRARRAHRQVEAGVQLGALVGAHDVDDELGRLGRERDLTALREVGEQPDAGAVGRAQQGDPPRAEVVEEDGVRHPAVAEGPDRAAVGVGDGGEGVAVVVGEGHPPEAVVAPGEGLPRHPRADPPPRTPGTTGRMRSCGRAGSSRRGPVAGSRRRPTGVCSGSRSASSRSPPRARSQVGRAGAAGRPAARSRSGCAVRTWAATATACLQSPPTGQVHALLHRRSSSRPAAGVATGESRTRVV